MGIENIMNIGATGINVNRLAIEVTSENIANVNTDGYSRQRTILETGPTTLANGFPLGSGVKLAAVQRSYDGLLQLQLVNNTSTYNQSLSRQTALQQLEPLFNELTSDGLNDSMQQFFNAWQDLSVNPQGIPERQAVLTRAQIMVDNFQQVSTGLTDTQKTVNDMLTGITADISDKAKNIATLNSQISQAEQSGANANELRDKRDLLIRQLSEDVGVSYFEAQDGTVSVSLPGGEELVTGYLYRTVYPSSSATSAIMITPLGNPPPSSDSTTGTDITATVGGSNNSLGKIGGILEVRDSVIPGYLDKLNELANAVAREVNTLHESGYGLNGSTGNDLFTVSSTTLAGTTTGSSNVISNIDTTGLSVGMAVSGPGIPAGTIITATPYSSPPAAAHSITLSTATTSANTNANYIFSGVNSATLSVAITDLNDLAASSTDPASSSGGAGNNENALSIAQIWETSLTFSSGSTSLGGFYNAFTSTVGVDLQSVNNEVSQGEAFLRQLDNLRESNSGVSLDEELTNLIKYQRAFQGCSKVLNTATEMLDTVLDMVR